MNRRGVLCHVQQIHGVGFTVWVPRLDPGGETQKGKSFCNLGDPCELHK